MLNFQTKTSSLGNWGEKNNPKPRQTKQSKKQLNIPKALSEIFPFASVLLAQSQSNAQSNYLRLSPEENAVLMIREHLVIHHPESDVLNQLQDHTQVLFGYENQNNRLVEGWRKACGREKRR